MIVLGAEIEIIEVGVNIRPQARAWYVQRDFACAIGQINAAFNRPAFTGQRDFDAAAG